MLTSVGEGLLIIPPWCRRNMFFLKDLSIIHVEGHHRELRCATGKKSHFGSFRQFEQVVHQLCAPQYLVAAGTHCEMLDNGANILSHRRLHFELCCFHDVVGVLEHLLRIHWEVNRMQESLSPRLCVSPVVD